MGWLYLAFRFATTPSLRDTSPQGEAFRIAPIYGSWRRSRLWGGSFLSSLLLCRFASFAFYAGFLWARAYKPPPHRKLPRPQHLPALAVLQNLNTCWLIAYIKNSAHVIYRSGPVLHCAALHIHDAEAAF